ncbi:STAS domain-containing protein (plasmid) [Streptomycetaceae bacterium NBC_01309]
MSEPLHHTTGAHTPSQTTPRRTDEARRAFGGWLTSVKLAAGDPSLRELTRRTGQLGEAVPRSTLADGFSGRRLLGLDQALLVVRVCGGGATLEAECRNRWMAARNKHVVRSLADSPAVRPRRDASPDLHPEHELLGPVHWELSPVGDATVLHLSGEWDFQVMGQLKPHLDALRRTPPDTLVVDVSDLTFADSTLTAGLVYCLRKLRDCGTHVRLALGTRPQGDIVTRVLQLTGATNLLPVHDSLEDALTQVPGRVPPAATKQAAGVARASLPIPTPKEQQEQIAGIPRQQPTPVDSPLTPQQQNRR